MASRLRALLPREDRVLVTALILLVLGLAFILIASQVSSGDTQGFDEKILRALRSAGDPMVTIGPSWAEGTALEITSLGSAGVLTTVVVAVIGYFAIERRFVLLGVTIVATVGGWLSSASLKELIGRTRPTVVPHLQQVTSPSFPSGHAMLSATVYLTLGVLLARSTKDRRLRIYFVVMAMFLTCIVGLTRVFLGVHYPTDVLAGWIGGAFWALLCALVQRALERRGVTTPGEADDKGEVPNPDASEGRR